MENEKLPRGWVKTTCSLFLGEKSSSFDPRKYPDERFELYSVPSHASAHPEIVLGSEIGSNKQYVDAGDVLISKINPRLNRTWVVRNYTEHRNIASTEWIRFPGTAGLKNDYLAYFLTQYWVRDFLSENASGIGGSLTRVRPKIFDEIQLSLPPLNEQRRIVEKIEELFSELDAGVENLRTARTQLGVYRQSLLKQAFEGKLTERWRAEHADELESPDELLARIRQEREARYQQQLSDWKSAISQWERDGKPGKKPSKPRKPKPLSESNNSFSNPLPDRWVSINLGETTVEIFDGPFGSNLKTSDYVDSGVRVIRLENIGCGAFIEEKHSYISHEKYHCLQRHTVFPGDIVFSSFLNDSVRASIVPDSVEYAVNKADCFCVRCYGSILSKDYLLQAFLARYFYKALESQVHGVGRPRINTTQLGSAPIPFCSLAEQREIVRLLEEQFGVIEENEREIDAALERAEALRQSILKKAFAGELVPQDPDDEPASVLLERIRAEREAQAAKPARRHVARKPRHSPSAS
jgi:type I restriction enzyme S subunit